MPKLIPITAEKLIKILIKIGFVIVRIKGSHHFLFRVLDNKTTTIPIHRGEQIGQGLLRQILRDIDMSVDEYDNLRTKK